MVRGILRLYLNKHLFMNRIGHVSTSIKLKRTIWNIISLFLFRFLGTKLFRRWRIMLLKIFGADIKWDS